MAVFPSRCFLFDFFANFAVFFSNAFFGTELCFDVVALEEKSDGSRESFAVASEDGNDGIVPDTSMIGFVNLLRVLDFARNFDFDDFRDMCLAAVSVGVCGDFDTGVEGLFFPGGFFFLSRFTTTNGLLCLPRSRSTAKRLLKAFLVPFVQRGADVAGSGDPLTFATVEPVEPHFASRFCTSFLRRLRFERLTGIFVDLFRPRLEAFSSQRTRAWLLS